LVTKKSSRKTGRPPIGHKAMTPAQRARRYRKKLRREKLIRPKQERRRQREAELAAATVKASLALGSKLYGRALCRSTVGPRGVVARARDGSPPRQPLPGDVGRSDQGDQGARRQRLRAVHVGDGADAA